MFEHFETHITSITSFTKEELRRMRLLSAEKKLRRRQLLLHEGEVCRYKAFVVKGLLKTYRKKDDGTEHIMKFAAENSWMIDAESFNNQTPSRYNIEAVEDTDVIVWPRENLHELFTAVPAFKLYSEQLITRTLEASQNRILMNISYTAEEKYQDFITSFPDIFRRIPLHMVASYLGVSRETLSRVRHAQIKRQKNLDAGESRR